MSLKIAEENINFETYSEVLSAEAKEKIKKNEPCIFITPNRGWRANKNWLYPKETADFVKYVNQETQQNATYLSDPEEILSLNNIDSYLPIITLGIDFILKVGIESVVDIVIEYLKNKYPRIFSNSKNQIHFKIQIEKRDKKSMLKLEYDGPANDIKNTFTGEKISEIIDRL
ncbi:MAG: hypothetical protein NTU57_05030 [Candidatus Aenigmarchaeota archaeon]|nr:hypothetical protein [Candidatus Aenigmarchaeota archaeon]